MLIQIIQLSAQQVTCARFKRAGSRLTPIFGIRFDYAAFDELPGLLQEQLPACSDDLHTILALPPALLSLRELQLPISDRTKLRAVLPLELSSDSTEEGSEPACDAVQLGPGSQLAGWLPRQTVIELITLLTGCGLEPEVVTCHPLSWHLLQLPDQQPAAVLDAEALAIVDQGRLLFCRFMDTADTAAVARTLAAVELARSITTSTCYRLDTEPLADQQPLPLPPELAELPSQGDLPPQALLSPLALARAYCSGDIFNLRNGALAWSGARSRLLRQFRVPLLLGLLVLCALFAEAGLRWYLLQRDLGEINRSIAAIYKGAFPTRAKAVDEIGEFKSEIKRLRAAGGANGELLAFLQLLAQAKDEQITAISEVEYDTERFRLKGDSRTTPAVTALGRSLTAAGWSVNQPELTSRPDGTTLFVLKGQREGTRK